MPALIIKWRPTWGPSISLKIHAFAAICRKVFPVRASWKCFLYLNLKCQFFLCFGKHSKIFCLPSQVEERHTKDCSFPFTMGYRHLNFSRFPFNSALFYLKHLNEGQSILNNSKKKNIWHSFFSMYPVIQRGISLWIGRKVSKQEENSMVRNVQEAPRNPIITMYRGPFWCYKLLRSWLLWEGQGKQNPTGPNFQG